MEKKEDHVDVDEGRKKKQLKQNISLTVEARAN